MGDRDVDAADLGMEDVLEVWAFSDDVANTVARHASSGMRRVLRRGGKKG